MYQRTLAKRVSITGIGIHSGKKVTLVLHPAEANTGIRFRRTDLENVPSIRASVKTVGATENNTTLGDGENSVHTVEHLLSVLYGLGIDNVLCEIDGPEVPIMDGSGASFVYILKETGITNLGASKKFFLVIMTQIIIDICDANSFDPKPFIISLMLSCSCSFITPYGYATNLIIQGTGGYKFIDYFKYGIFVKFIGFFITFFVYFF